MRKLVNRTKPHEIAPMEIVATEICKAVYSGVCACAKSGTTVCDTMLRAATAAASRLAPDELRVWRTKELRRMIEEKKHGR